jgi:SAM-dependent methyltransferase
MKYYVHGYTEREAQRLFDQSGCLRDLLHHDSIYPPGSHVLEAGCGVGAQTVTLARQNPGVQFTSIDVSSDYLARAQATVAGLQLTNVRFQQADILALPFADESFDHIFVCYVLEHLPNPVEALAALRRVLKRGGTLTAIEGDHGSCFFHPETREALHVWNCLIRAQAGLGGNSLIGRELFPLLTQAGFSSVRVSPRFVYCDHSRPDLIDGFVRKTIIAMVEGVKTRALEMGLADETSWAAGIRALNRVADEPRGTFCYTFFKAVGVK